jgi:hypothetical protein
MTFRHFTEYDKNSELAIGGGQPFQADVRPGETAEVVQ